MRAFDSKDSISSLTWRWMGSTRTLCPRYTTDVGIPVCFSTQIYGGTWSGAQVRNNPMLTSTHGTSDVDIDLASIFIDSYFKKAQRLFDLK